MTVVDLTGEYGRIGVLLTARTGLSGSVVFVNASALDLPFDNE